MFWDMEVRDNETFIIHRRGYPFYQRLGTEYDTINKKVWHKIAPDDKMAKLVVKYGKTNYEIREEITGEKYLWVTDNALFLAGIEGACEVDD